MNSLKNWLDKIFAFTSQNSFIELQNFNEIINQTKWNKKKCPVVTVTGTNGKGSCVAMLEGIFLEAGYRVGTYSSPHLLTFNERIRINGLPVTHELLCKAFETVEKVRSNRYLPFFHYITLAALYLFQQIDLDILILEVGIGGRLDAVNSVDCDLAIVTSIGIDHEDRLGNTREKIGFEKAGIFRSFKPVICGDPCPPLSVIEQAKKISAPFFGIGKDFDYEEHPFCWSWKSARVQWEQLPIPSLALQNVSTALKAVECLQDSFNITRDPIERALKKVFLLGRFQTSVKDNRLHIFDVAHNPSGSQFLARQMERIPSLGKTHVVFSIMDNKDVEGIVLPFMNSVDHWYLGVINHPKAASLTKMENALKRAEGLSSAFRTVTEAYQNALENSQENDRILIFGSFYAVGEVLAFIGDDHV